MRQWIAERPFLQRTLHMATIALVIGTLLFLATIEEAQAASDSLELETRNWRDSWVVEPGRPGGEMAPPAALQLTLQLEEWGEMRRLYALPPL